MQNGSVCTQTTWPVYDDDERTKDDQNESDVGSAMQGMKNTKRYAR
jgi:hypothetical protein